MHVGVIDEGENPLRTERGDSYAAHREMPLALPVPHETRRFTVREVMRMVESGILGAREPVELLAGELVVVSAQGPPHAGSVTAVRDRIGALYGSGFVVRDSKPIVAGRYSLPEPDIAVVRGTHADFAKRHPTVREAVLLAEFAWSSHTLDHAKAAIYARAGAREYWIIDLLERRLEVHRRPTRSGRFAVVRNLDENASVRPPGLRTPIHVRDLML